MTFKLPTTYLTAAKCKFSQIECIKLAIERVFLVYSHFLLTFFIFVRSKRVLSFAKKTFPFQNLIIWIAVCLRFCCCCHEVISECHKPTTHLIDACVDFRHQQFKWLLKTGNHLRNDSLSNSHMIAIFHIVTNNRKT